jgi:hypothetical protein
MRNDSITPPPCRSTSNVWPIGWAPPRNLRANVSVTIATGSDPLPSCSSKSRPARTVVSIVSKKPGPTRLKFTLARRTFRFGTLMYSFQPAPPSGTIRTSAARATPGTERTASAI